MNLENDNKVGVKEYSGILMICLCIKATDTTPVLFYKEAMNAGWIIPLISSVIVFISLKCMLKLLERYKDKNLIQIMYQLLGKYIAFIIGIILSVCITIANAVNMRQYTDIMTTIYFRRTPTIALLLILTVSSCIIARFGFEAIGRISWMILPWIIIIHITFFILVYNLIKIDYLYPLGGAGIKSVLKGGVRYSTIFSEVILYSIIFPKVKSYKEYSISSFISLGYAALLISIMSAVYLMVLDYPPIIINSTPFHTVARLIYGGRFISNLEAFFFLFWIIATLVRFSMYLLVNAEIFSFTMKHKESKPLIIPISALSMLIGLLPYNFFQNAFMTRAIFLSIMWPLIYMIPCIMLLLSQRRRDSK